MKIMPHDTGMYTFGFGCGYSSKPGFRRCGEIERMGRKFRFFFFFFLFGWTKTTPNLTHEHHVWHNWCLKMIEKPLRKKKRREKRNKPIWILHRDRARSHKLKFNIFNFNIHFDLLPSRALSLSRSLHLQNVQNFYAISIDNLYIHLKCEMLFVWHSDTVYAHTKALLTLSSKRI